MSRCVVLADLAMPCEDGFALLAQLRADPPLTHVPVMAITAHARGEDRARCVAAGFDGYMARPIDMNVVIDTVARLAADGRSTMDTSASRDPKV